ncbi:MAG: hypothetical protein GY941_11975 [Planctomycetes bacterium]|nr:hypothetical protein [Planctomycetota bacterium]
MQIPGKTFPVELSDNGTVQDAIDKAGVNTQGFNVSVSGDASATPASTLDPGAKVLLTKDAKGAL